jgi:hypothetical protein
MPLWKNEQWNVICMKKEFHAKFAPILQIIYQQERLAYFSNRIAITFDLANKGQPMNWCFIVLTKFLVEFTCWKQCQKKKKKKKKKLTQFLILPK